jgi:glycosyltransferase involved in cell wall biosynthesis
VRFHPSIPNPIAFARLIRLLRRLRPDLVETWLYKADLLGGLATIAGGRPPLVWSVHQTALEPVGRLRSNVLTAKICARLSPWLPTLVGCVTEEVARAHAGMGYPTEKLRVVPNGIDTERFRPDPAARARIRTEIGLSESTPLVGLVARFDPQKDHRTFAEAARQIAARVPEAHFVLCGREISRDNSALTRLLDVTGLRERVALLGVRDDMPAVTAALDVAQSSSAFGEASSLAILEAMASAVPSVATDTGNVADVIRDAGAVVPPRDAAALAAATVELLELPSHERAALGARARGRVVAQFSIIETARGYERLYEEALSVAPRRARN